MRTITLESFLDLHRVIQNARFDEVIFRGVSDAAYGLIPKIGRLPNYSPSIERNTLHLFKQHGCSFVDREPLSDWDWLAIAQHHGLPTRLLDWTYNPLVAAYFAVEHPRKDGAIYYMDAPMILDTKGHKNPLVRTTGVDIFEPDHRTRRIAAQSGLFTIHWAPRIAVTQRKVSKLIIPASTKREFREGLNRYGVHAGALFPDLDGQARFITWMMSRQ